jgi:GxxExxY protein
MASPDANLSIVEQAAHVVIGCGFDVLNRLGGGFVEKVYENALAYEIRERGLTVRQQHGISVFYKNIVAGQYVADLLVEDQLLVELKATKNLEEAHAVQCMNYLKGTGLTLCLLLNFGSPKLRIRRIVNHHE